MINLMTHSLKIWVGVIFKILQKKVANQMRIFIKSHEIEVFIIP